MNTAEARSLLESQLKTWRNRSHAELAALVGQQAYSEALGPSGTTYQIEVEAFWDGARGGDIRVVGSIDDGGLRAFVPVTGDFIVAPDGHLVGESR